MTTNFPGSLDSFTNPSATDAMDSVTVPHATQHADLNDAVEALQAKVGVDGSAVTTSLDYKVAQQGLTFVKSVTIGSGVSSVTVTDAFDSRFENYLIGITGSSSANSGVKINLVGSTASYQWALNYTNYSGVHNIIAGNNTATWEYLGSMRTTGASFTIPIYSPAIARPTSIGSVVWADTGATGITTGYHNVSTAYTGFVVSLGTGTFGGGTIRVYGYNNGA